MRLSGNLVQGRLLRRLNRFAVVVEIGGREEATHLPNSGRLHALMIPGAPVYLTPRPERHGRTHFDLALIDIGGTLVSVDARLPSALFAEAVGQSRVPLLQGHTALRREVRWRESRLDLLVERDPERWLIETKSITLVQQGIAFFPDAPTERGRRHLRTLTAALDHGFRSAVVFVVGREDAIRFRPCDEVDPLFGQELRAAAAAGVEIWAYRCRVTREGVEIAEFIPVEL